MHLIIPKQHLISSLFQNFQTTLLSFHQIFLLLFPKKKLRQYGSRASSYVFHAGDFDKGEFHSYRRDQTCLGIEGLRRLTKSLTVIQAVLREAAKRPETDDLVKLLLVRLQDVAYDAEDVLDEFAYKILRKEQKKGKVRECFSLHNPIAFRLNMGKKFKKINEALDEIQEDAAVLSLVSTSPQHEDRAQEVCWDLDRETDSFLDSLEVVGRDDDVSIVTEKLTSLTKQHILSVVPIVGMAGLGKTTVAKKVCEVVREGKQFDVALWVCVSNDFNKVKILGAMLQIIDKTTGGLTNLDAILQNLKKKLENKTFFLVLDDVWNDTMGSGMI